MADRQKEIREKGFNMGPRMDTTDVYHRAAGPIDFSKIKVGLKILEDAVVNVGDYKTIDSRLADKKEVLRAIHDNDEETMREISDYFYNIFPLSGMFRQQSVSSENIIQSAFCNSYYYVVLSCIKQYHYDKFFTGNS